MKSLTKIFSPLLALFILLAGCTASAGMALSNKSRITNPAIS